MIKMTYAAMVMFSVPVCLATNTFVNETRPNGYMSKPEGGGEGEWVGQWIAEWPNTDKEVCGCEGKKAETGNSMGTSPQDEISDKTESAYYADNGDEGVTV